MDASRKDIGGSKRLYCWLSSVALCWPGKCCCVSLEVVFFLGVVMIYTGTYADLSTLDRLDILQPAFTQLPESSGLNRMLADFEVCNVRFKSEEDSAVWTKSFPATIVSRKLYYFQIIEPGRREQELDLSAYIEEEAAGDSS